MTKEEFSQIGTGTAVGSEKWNGPVIASEDAIYCVLKPASGNSAGVLIGGLLGGAVGGAIAGAISQAAHGGKTTASANATAPTEVFASLPEAWRKQLSKYPIGLAEPNAPMLVLRKDDVARVTKKKWYRNTFAIERKAGAETVQVTAFGFGISKKLHEWGWPVS